MFKKLGFVAVVMSMAACGGSADDGAFACVVGSGASQSCIAYKNAPAEASSSLRTACTGQEKGTVVSSCPTANLVGCCTYDSSGLKTEACYYTPGTADQLMSTCTSPSESNGTWSTTP